MLFLFFNNFSYAQNLNSSSNAPNVAVVDAQKVFDGYQKGKGCPGALGQV